MFEIPSNTSLDPQSSFRDGGSSQRATVEAARAFEKAAGLDGANDEAVEKEERISGGVLS